MSYEIGICMSRRSYWLCVDKKYRYPLGDNEEAVEALRNLIYFGCHLSLRHCYAERIVKITFSHPTCETNTLTFPYKIGDIYATNQHDRSDSDTLLSEQLDGNN